jgi:hypothetical protein
MASGRAGRGDAAMMHDKLRDDLACCDIDVAKSRRSISARVKMSGQQIHLKYALNLMDRGVASRGHCRRFAPLLLHQMWLAGRCIRQ